MQRRAGLPPGQLAHRLVVDPIAAQLLVEQHSGEVAGGQYRLGRLRREADPVGREGHVVAILLVLCDPIADAGMHGILGVEPLRPDPVVELVAAGRVLLGRGHYQRAAVGVPIAGLEHDVVFAAALPLLEAQVGFLPIETVAGEGRTQKDLGRVAFVPHLPPPAGRVAANVGGVELHERAFPRPVGHQQRVPRMLRRPLLQDVDALHLGDQVLGVEPELSLGADVRRRGLHRPAASVQNGRKQNERN